MDGHTSAPTQEGFVSSNPNPSSWMRSQQAVPMPVPIPQEQDVPIVEDASPNLSSSSSSSNEEFKPDNSAADHPVGNLLKGPVTTCTGGIEEASLIDLHSISHETVPPQTDSQQSAHEAVLDRGVSSVRVPLYKRGHSTLNQGSDESWGFDLFNLHHAKFELTDGDTLVFVDFPEPPRGSKGRADCQGIAWNSQTFVVHSNKLLATGSQKFAELLGPSSQYRVQRRRKLVNKLPEGIRFVLDLTPPSEGDELVFQMTELSLTPGIAKWWMAKHLHKVEGWIVGGHDDVCPSCPRLRTGEAQPLDSTKPNAGHEGDIHLPEPPKTGEEVQKHLDQLINKATEVRSSGTGSAAEGSAAPRDGVSLSVWVKPSMPPKPNDLMEKKARNENQVIAPVPHHQIPDYCPFRHRNCIMRLLMLIEGRHLSLDSASRVWTMVGVAKIFDCTSLLRDLVAQWIMHGNNVKFIEILPEEALRLGFSLELPDITQCAFRILVNELALKETAPEDWRSELSHVTVFGRRTGDAGDEQANLIQHATRAFLDRLHSQAWRMQSLETFDLWNIDGWKKLRAIERLLIQRHGVANLAEPVDALFRDALEKLRGFMEALPLKVKRRFEQAMESDGWKKEGVLNGMDLDRATYIEPMDFVPLELIMERMVPAQRLLCPFIYADLEMKFEKRMFKNFGDVTPTSAGARMKSLEAALLHIMRACPELATDPTLRHDWSLVLDEFTMKIRDFSMRQPVIRSPLIDLYDLDEQVKMRIRPIAHGWIRHDIEPPLNMTRHMLLTLTQNELKFLPLWAGGLNDGTGGVFEAALPPADMGPNGPGPAYHTGMTLPSAPSSLSGSLLEEIRDMKVAGSTTIGSVDVQDSISTVYRPDKVIGLAPSVQSESFASDSSQFREAEYAVPADHQGRGQALAQLINDTSSEWDHTPDEDDTPTGSVDGFDDSDNDDNDDNMNDMDDDMVKV